MRKLLVLILIFAILGSVVSAESTIKISKIEDVKVSINQNDKYALPKNVTAIMSNNTKQLLSVVWNVKTINTSKTGTFKYLGTVKNYNKKVNLVITINPNIKSIEDIKIEVRHGAVFKLPETVPALMTDGTKRVLPVTWDGTLVNASLLKDYTIKGVIKGYSKPVTLKVSVTPSIIFIYNINEIVQQGNKYSLPTHIAAEISDGSKKQLPVVWDSITINTNNKDIFEVPGTITDLNVKIKATIKVVSQDEYNQLKEVALINEVDSLQLTILQGQSYNLPIKVKTYLNDGATKEMPVVWNTRNVDTRNSGNYTLEGNIFGYPNTVYLKLDILPIEFGLEQIKETEHFIFIYSSVDASLIDDVINYLEESYEKVASDLGSNDLPKLYVKIFPSREKYHEYLKVIFPNFIPKAYSVGTGIANMNTLSFVSPNNPATDQGHTYSGMLKVAVHEFTHVVAHKISTHPRWLSESIASYEAKQLVDLKNNSNITQSNFPTISQLNDPEIPVVYTVGYTVIEYIVNKWGIEAVRNLIKSNGDIPGTLNITVNEFEMGWKNYVTEKYLK